MAKDDLKEPAEEVRYWIDEISIAKKREDDYRKDGDEVMDIYAGKKADETPFNILFSNVETLLPALYSQTPRPIVSRRFKDEDVLGKAASTAGQRMLEYMIDTNVEGYETFDDSMINATLDALLPGRGVTSIKYEADITENPSSEEDVPSTSVVQWEQICTDSRLWNRVIFGYSNKWSKTPWIAYEEYLDEEESERLFGEEIAKGMTFSSTEEDDDENKKHKYTKDKGGRKTALVYQIWDKDGGKKIRYISPNYPLGYLKEDDDPLGLTGFFNCPRPIQFIRKSNETLPVAMYKLYENQATELNKITVRIGKIINALKVRGVYDGSMGSEIEKILEGDDLTLIPTDKSGSLIEGGIDKNIWFMPIDKLIIVLQQLVQTREQTKRVIYEITGVSDILRGQSAASETLGAQKIKESWGTMRIKRLQKEVQRYSRDILRIMLEIAATKFNERSWAMMTGLPYPTTEQKQQAQSILQTMQGQQIPGQQPQPPDPEIMQAAQSPSWGEILNILKNDMQRSYRIDIETNSTIDVEATEDQKNIAEVMQAIAQFMHGIGPLVDSGAMPFQVMQEMLLTITRRYRFGNELEDSIKKMQQPQVKNPEADKAKAEMAQSQADNQLAMQELGQKAQQEQAALQAEMQRSQIEAEGELRIQAANLQAEKEIALNKLRAEMEMDANKLQAQKSIDQMKAAIQQQTELKKTALTIAGQIEIAHINAESQAKTAAMTESSNMESESKDMNMQHDDMMARVMETQDKLLAMIAAPKKVIRDAQGRATGITTDV